MVERTSYRVYTAHELRTMPQAALRASAPPPKTGITGSGVAFLFGVALAIGGASWAAMHYVKPDFIATANAMEVKVQPPATPAQGDPAAPPAFEPGAQMPVATPAPPPTSASAKQLAKPKKGRRQARPRPSSDSSGSGEPVPPNPFDILANVDRAPTVRQ